MLKKILSVVLFVLCFSALPLTGAAWAQAPVENPIDTDDMAFVLISSALVLLMTPGLAFFYVD